MAKITAVPSTLSNPKARKDAAAQADAMLEADGGKRGRGGIVLPNKDKPKGATGAVQAKNKPATSDAPQDAPAMRPAPAGGFTPEQIAQIQALLGARNGKGEGKRGRAKAPRPNLVQLAEQLKAIGPEKIVPGAIIKLGGVYDHDQNKTYICVVLTAVNDFGYPQAYVAGEASDKGAMERAKALSAVAKQLAIPDGREYLDHRRGGPGSSWITLEWEPREQAQEG